MKKRTNKTVAGVTAISAAWLAAAAFAAPQETANFAAVNSNGGANNAANVVVTHGFTGGYAVKSIRITGDVSQVNTGTWRSEARLAVTTPSGQIFEVQPSVVGATWAGAAQTTDLQLPVPIEVADAAGTWSFRFYESADDGGTSSVDAVWNSISITLDDAPLASGTALVGSSPFGELEPNDSTYGQATPTGGLNGAAAPGGISNVVTLASGEAITGTTTGTVTTSAGGATGTDSFRIKTAAAAPGIYRHLLSLTTTGTTGHSGSIRGHSQTTTYGAGPGVVTTGSDIGLQASQTVGAARNNVFYGFGMGEEVHYRVSGGASTTQPYTTALTSTAVLPTAVPNPLASGSITISRGTGNTNTWDAIILDSNYNVVPGANIHGASSGSFTRSLPAGTYYVAVSNATTSDGRASAADSTTRTNSLVTLPGALLNTSTTTSANMNMNFIDGLGTQTMTSSKAAAFDVNFYEITVQNVTTPPTGVGSSTPTAVLGGNVALLKVAVTPGTNPASTNLAVTADLSAIGGSASQMFFDDGSNGDVTPGDNQFSYAIATPMVAGSHSLPFSISDDEARSGNGNIAMSIFLPPASFNDMGTLVAGDNVGPTVALATAEATWYKFTVGSVSVGDNNWLDIVSSATLSGGTFTNDTIIGLYNADGTVRASDDDDGPVSRSALTFGLASPTRANGDGPVHNGRDGALTAGTYYLAVSGYNCSYATGFAINPTSNSSGSVGISMFLGPAATNPTVAGNTSSGSAGGTATILATVTPGDFPPSTGVTVTGDLSGLGGSASQLFFNDGTNGDVTAGDNIHTFVASIPMAAAEGSTAVALTVNDAELRSAAGNATVNVDGHGQSLATATAVASGPVVSVSGVIGAANDVDMFKIFICDPASFSAETVTGPGTLADTQLFLFDSAGMGVAFNDDEIGGVNNRSWMDGPLTAALPAGEYYIAVGDWDTDPVNAANAALWIDTPYESVRAADGPGATDPLDHWDTGGGDTGTYTITFTGVSGDPCAPPTGACCRGQYCEVMTADDCALVFGTYEGNGTICDPVFPATCSTYCGTADFNNDGAAGLDDDIEAFFLCLGGDCCPTCSTADFNGDGAAGLDDDIEAFFLCLGGDCC